MSTILESKGTIYLSQKQFEKLASNGELIVGAEYNIIDANPNIFYIPIFINDGGEYIINYSFSDIINEIDQNKDVILIFRDKYYYRNLYNITGKVLSFINSTTKDGVITIDNFEFRETIDSGLKITKSEKIINDQPYLLDLAALNNQEN